MLATMEICMLRRSDGVEVGCWPWWATPLPVLGLVLLLYLLLRETR